MDINGSKANVIFESQYYPGVAVAQIAMKDNLVYISLPTPNKSGDNVDYPLVCYDMKNNKQEVLEKGTTAFLVIFKNELYYIRIDNEKKITNIMQYDFQTKKKTMLAKGNEQDGYFYSLTTDGTSLIAQVNYPNDMGNYYQLETNPVKLIPYVKIPNSDSFVGSDGYFTWYGTQENDKQIRKPISFLDSKKKILYKYDGALIYFSKKGVLWVKYTKPESKIPKMKIFDNDNNDLMWQPFN